MTLRQLLNVTYSFLVEGSSEKEVRRLDHVLDEPLKKEQRRDGRPPAITPDILQVMRFMPPPKMAKG